MMKLNKKVVESMTVTASLLVMTTITAFGGSTEDSKGNVTENVALGKNGTAGIISELRNMESGVFEDGGLIYATVERTQNDMVAESVDEETADFAGGAAGLDELAAATLQETQQAATESEATVEEAAPEETAAEDTQVADAEVSDAEESETIQTEETADPEWANRVMADVDEDMNIRTSPDAGSELAGKLYKGDVAEVVSVDPEWTQITSGDVTGYVKNDYLVYGDDANALANEVCSLYATVTADALRLRSEPSEEADVVTTAANGDKLKVDKDTEAADGWIAVSASGTTAYVKGEYVSVALNLGTALTAEQVAEKEAKEAGITKKPAASANGDEVTLLGALIQCEAGNGSYEGMLAVGAVVMNRVRSGAYPNSISGVVYQGGQFTPALSGSVAAVAASGVKSSCLQAAQEAISGIDNTNGALQFRSAASGAQGTVIGANVFF